MSYVYSFMIVGNVVNIFTLPFTFSDKKKKITLIESSQRKAIMSLLVAQLCLETSINIHRRHKMWRAEQSSINSQIHHEISCWRWVTKQLADTHQVITAGQNSFHSTWLLSAGHVNAISWCQRICWDHCWAELFGQHELTFCSIYLNIALN